MRTSGHHALLLLKGSGAQRLGPDARLGLPHGAPCPVPKENYSYAGVIEALSGAPFDVHFISFEDIKNNPAILDDLDVIINVGDADTAHTGGIWWEDVEVAARIRQYIAQGGGFIGVGEPAGHQYQGRYLQLAGLMGVEKETGFT